MEDLMRRTLVAVMTVAALGAGTISNAQAHDEAAPFIAGAVIGTVLGVVVANRPVAVLPPVAVAPPARVVVVERPVVVRRGPPVYVQYRQPYKPYRNWYGRHDGRHRDEHHRDWH
jgi:hypothetical protein